MKSVADWFGRNAWTPFAFQREVWDAYLAGAGGLIHSATGTGKTLAAFLGPVEAWLREPAAGRPKGAPPLRMLWITPMRALAADTLEALRRPVAELGLPWTIGARTGDTSSAERARQAKQLPTVLVTTPESVSLMLAAPAAREQLSGLHCVIVDEWHELMGSKRGVQTELALARLRRWNPELRTWGLSATLGNLPEALACLLGTGYDTSRARIVKGETHKRIVIDTLIPPDAEHFPWAGHLGLVMLGHVIEAVEGSRSTLVFTNTRSQAEIWYQGLLAAKPGWAGEIALHHGSLDLEVRRWVESGIKEGRLRCVVATSSLDLGVDFSPVERVLQIGSPKGIARLLQRAGRSGHAPGQVSRVSCVPSHAFEFIESAAARRAALAGKVEARSLVERPLDLLTQHLVTLALGAGFRPEQLLPEILSAYSYRDLQPGEWQWALDFVTRGGDALKAYDEYRKVEIDADGVYRVHDAAVARRHRMNIGTIVSDASMNVSYLRGKRLGTVEESFVARLSPGDAFIFAGKHVELIRVRDMTAYVKPAAPSRTTVPRWMGAKMSFSNELAASVRELLEAFLLGKADAPEFVAVERLLRVQRTWSRVPRAHELLFEQTQTREGHHVYCYPFEGRHVHLALAALFAYRLGRIRKGTFTFSVNDYGFELLARDAVNLHEALRAGLLGGENLLHDVLASLNAAELAKRHFREIARVAGLVFQGYPGAGKSNKQLQATSGLIYDVFARWDSANPLLRQARDEVLQRHLEFSRLGDTLRRIRDCQVVVSTTQRPSPFAFPLMVERFREKLSNESLAERVKKMQILYDAAADGKPR